MLQDISQPQDQIATFSSSKTADVIDDTNTIILQGEAQVRRTDAILKGDRIDYDRESGQVTSTGNARLFQKGNLVTGPSLTYNVDKERGSIQSPIYRLNTGAAGHGRQADILDNNHMRMYDTFYTGCNCSADPVWYVKSSKIDVYDDENEGMADNGTLYIKGVPVLYSPWLTFPIKKEKKTGFLLPTYGYTSRSGYDFMLPYFINLAPNYDMTITPRYMTKRNFSADGEFRYVTKNSAGVLSGSFLPNDKEFKGRYEDQSKRRWTWTWLHQHKLGEVAGLHFDLDVNWSQASDDDYYRDLRQLSISQADKSYLEQRISLNFSGYKYWSGYLMLKKYQAMSDRDSDLLYGKYEKQPELFIRGERYDWGGFDLKTENTLTHFVFPKIPDGYWWDSYGQQADDQHGHLNPNGTRFMSYTSIAYPIERAGWYIKPKAGIHYSNYHTDWFDGYKNFAGFFSQNGSQIQNRSRTLPIVSVDSGLTFERNTTLFGHSAIQTLEPRLYYLYIPYRDQSDLPVYDTNTTSLDFATAFAENRYAGWDRINNANQITAGLTSRWLDKDTNYERLAVEVAQRFHMQKQRVTIDNLEREEDKSRSEFLAGVRGSITNSLKAQANVQYDPYKERFIESYATLRWNPKRLTSVSIAYRYQRDPYDEEHHPQTRSLLEGRENIIGAFQWPFTKNLSAVGRLDWSIRDRRNTQSLLGLEYRGDCCWAARLMMQRYVVSRTKSNSAIYFQVQLSGLGDIGTNPMEELRKNIPGYEDSTPKPIPVSTFEKYE
ncbi:LPS-assembly protein LptD [Brackiella oedipodis]|uniref:LPS-assembly protein LptD n=1 Tax=Brackiella oedipodis TaxID=124225 RepID=UPI000AE5D885|nr:LPS-assembly protein LptD [Brackiella oedipodis]